MSLGDAFSKLKERAFRAPYIAFFVVLVLLAFVADPYSFTRSWNEGRSAMLAVVPLVFLEAGRRSFRPIEGRRALIGWSSLLIAGIYYFAVAQPSVVNAMTAVGGKSFGVSPTILQFSWVWGIDYTVTSAFLGVLLFLDSGPKTITPLIYTVGMASFLFIDVILPENTLGPFGYVVPPALQVVAGLLNLSGLGTAQSHGNILMLQNNLGQPLNLQVFWPSAGLDGIVIGLLVVVAICVKVGTGWTRGVIYLVVGAIGSFLVNVVRLVVLALYAMANITDPKAFEAFHSVVGELIFIPWIILFVIFILRRESKIPKQDHLFQRGGIPEKGALNKVKSPSSNSLVFSRRTAIK